MRLSAWAWPDRRRLAGFLVILLAFSAWNLTGPAHIALFGLTALFLADLPAHWSALRREPALWLAAGALVLTSLLAVRGASLYPPTAAQQWPAIWEWSAPFLFIVVAWWLRADLRLVHQVLIAALAGTIVSILRKSDWSQLGEILAGMRYHFERPAMDVAFIAAAVLLGLIVYLGPITRLVFKGRSHPVLGWALWSLLVLFMTAVLVVVQGRGAVLSLVLAAGLLALYRVVGRGRPPGPRARRWALGLVLLLIPVLALVLWASRGRVLDDAEALRAALGSEALSWESSTTIRFNLWLTGLQLFEARPWLGWGPGTSSTGFLVPEGVVALPEATRARAPEASHLHSVVVEMLVRFGLAAALIGVPLLGLIAIAGRAMWRELATSDPRLRELLALSLFMTGLYFLYDYRLVHVELRFFLILQLGVLYTFWMHRGPASGPPP